MLFLEIYRNTNIKILKKKRDFNALDIKSFNETLEKYID